MHEHAAREPRLAAFWHDVGKPLASGERPHAEAGARIVRAALRRLTYDNDTVATVTALVREHSFNEDREPSAHAARVFLARVGRERARDLLALRRWDRIGRGFPIAPAQVAARERFEQLVEQEWEQPVALADLAVRRGRPHGGGAGRGTRRWGRRCGACSRRSWTNRR